MPKLYTITFTNKSGETTTRGFDTEKQAASYALALRDQGLDYEVVKNIAVGFNDWANNIYNA